MAFDLETAIAAWRRPYEINPAFSTDDIEELESSLRDRVEALMRKGLSEKEAFRSAVKRIGSYGAAEREYRKVYWGKVKREHRLEDELNWRFVMLKNYLKIALRNFQRQKGYSFINIAGLTLGLTCCLIIFQYIAFEKSFDHFNENADQLYRLNKTHVENNGAPATGARTGWAMGPALAEVPEVLRFARLHPEYDNAIIANPAQPGKAFEEEWVYYADPAFFEMFSYPLVKGKPGQVLSEPGTVLLSASAARKYFGSEDPMGRVLDVAGWIDGSFHVAGVFEDVPANSHLRFAVLLPMVDLLQRSQFSDPGTGWSWNNFITYVQLRQDADLEEAERKFTDVLRRNREEDYRPRNIVAYVDAQPLRDIHLNEALAAPKAVTGSYRAVYFFTLIGLITLLIALVNYVNLATARAMGRAREVGVRKVVGAQRRQLVVQFLCESALTNLAAVGLAVVLALALRPVVNDLAGTNLTLAMWTSAGFWEIFFAVFFAATLLAGLYPAFVLSSFRPVAVLKGKAGKRKAQVWLRRGLVVLQFSASIMLLIGTVVVYQQLDFMRDRDLGIDLEQVLAVQSPRLLPESTNQADVIAAFIQEIRRLPAVRQTATSSALPGQGFSFWTDNIRKVTADQSTEVPGGITWIDTSFVRLYGLELVTDENLGRLSIPEAGGGPDLVLINETTMRAVGFDTAAEAIGQPLYVGGERRIVGVVKDFDWSSAHNERANAVFFLSREGHRHISVKAGTENLPGTIAAIEGIYKRFFSGNPFQYAFVDEQFDRQYRNEERFARLFSLFAGLATVIACLGLFGLASFTAQQRTKEIGVRKVLGASAGSVVALLSKDFLVLVAGAFVIATPVAYYFMNRWLQDFAYRIELGLGVFLLAGMIAVWIALLTVGYQSIRAALADPVKSLRYE